MMCSTGFPHFAAVESQSIRNLVLFATDGNFSISSGTGVHRNSLGMDFTVSYSDLWVNVGVFMVYSDAFVRA